MNICHFCHRENNNNIYCDHCNHNLTTCYLDIGTMLYHGRYKIHKPLGAGGMASIYIAVDTNLDNIPCVIKVMTDDFKDVNERERAIQSFKEEAVMLARLRHPSLPVVQNHFIEDGRYFLVMDYIAGHTLDEILERAINKDSLLPWEKVVEWGIQLCDVLEYLHSRKPMVIHRDIKPENIMEEQDGLIMLIDFGIARIFSKKRQEPFLGTFGYAAPEQYRGSPCSQSDIFGLGVSLHRLITGFNPSDPDNKNFNKNLSYPPMITFRDDVPFHVDDVISKAIALDIKDRYSSAKEFKEALVKLIKKSSELNIPRRPEKTLPAEGKAVLSDSENQPPLFLEHFTLNSGMGVNEFKIKLSKVAALDIGSYEIKLLQMDIDKNNYLYPRVICSKKTPAGKVVNGFIKEPEVLSETIKSMVENIKDLEIVASLSPYCFSMRTLQVPQMTKDKLSSFLLPQLNHLIPLHPDECHIEYEILSPLIPGNENYMSVRLTATSKNAYKSLQNTLELAGLNSDNIIPEPFVLSILARSLIEDENKKRNMALINIGSDGTSLNFIKDGVLFQSSFFTYGGKFFTEAIMKEKNVSFDVAEEIKLVVSNKNIEKNKKIDYLNILTPCFKEWIDGFHRAQMLFDGDYKIDKFDSVIFCGGGIQLEKFQKCIDEQLGISLYKFFLPLNKNNIENNQCELSDIGPSYMPSIGLIVSYFKDICEIEEITGINRSIYKLTSIKSLSEKGKATSRLPDVLSKEGFYNMKEYLVSVAGPMGGLAFDNIIKRRGYPKDTVPFYALDGLIELFIKEFELPQNKVSDVKIKIEELKKRELKKEEILNKTGINIKEKGKDTVSLPRIVSQEKFKELIEFISSVEGPMAVITFNECMRKKGYTKNVISVEKLEEVLCTFSEDFNLSDDKKLAFMNKINELAPGETKGFRMSSSLRQQKKGFLSFLFNGRK